MKRDRETETKAACAHELVLNGACFYCGTTDLDPIAMSPKQPPLIDPTTLVRRPK